MTCTAVHRSILQRLVEIRGAELRDDLMDVLIFQDDQDVYLALTTVSGTQSSSLTFIESSDGPVFSPELSIEENISRFMEMTDVESLCMTTDLVKTVVCEACLK